MGEPDHSDRPQGLLGTRARRFSRRTMLAALVAVEALLVVVLTLAMQPASAQFFDRNFPFFFDNRPYRPWYEPEERPRQRAPSQPQESTRPPNPRKHDAAVTTRILVLGDGLSDWLAYGLEEAFADTLTVGVVRKGRANTGLLRPEGRGDQTEWLQRAREALAAEKPDFVVMMVGLHDRRTIRDRTVRSGPSGPTEDDEQPAKPGPDSKTAGGTHEFRSDGWTEHYRKRTDEMMALLKSKNVPVFWVGLPPIRGSRQTAEVLYLNDLYRAQATQAQGITFVDIWDGFIGDTGQFALNGPDVDGQTRRLRTGDGIHFTKTGARKLAHYVERPIRRLLQSASTPIAALPKDEEPAAPRDSIYPGPVIALTGKPSTETELLGEPQRRSTGLADDSVAARVLRLGEALPPLPGRADDFAWPRRAGGAAEVIVPVEFAGPRNNAPAAGAGARASREDAPAQQVR